MQERLRYVTARPSLKNPKRWYWQRPGFPLTRLKDALGERVAQVAQLNARADGTATVGPGSIGWVVNTYRESDEYLALSKGTERYYRRILADVEALGTTHGFADALTRRATIEFVTSYKRGMRRQVGAVVRNLFNIAMYHGHAQSNHAQNLRLKAPERRTQTFTEAEAQKWLDHCNDATMRLAFTILRYAVQRPGDVLAMGWSQYNGDTIRLRQQKTGTLVDVPCHSDLRAALAEAKAITRHVKIVSTGLKAIPYTTFRARFKRVSVAAGLPNHQARDLRRTAAVRMAEAGATTAEIAAVGGWTIEHTQQILETYLPRNVEMARAGVLKWERKGQE